MRKKHINYTRLFIVCLTFVAVLFGLSGIAAIYGHYMAANALAYIGYIPYIGMLFTGFKIV